MTKTLGSTAIYAYTTLVSVVICTPLALFVEGPTLVEGAKAAIAKVGAQRFYLDLLAVGMLYHLYNQVRRRVHARRGGGKVLRCCARGCARGDSLTLTI